ncbi:hypothetical protein NDU88_003968 [Pleurodeles waltl]|uniref:Uncharacterized protein n=1 Tax=Pleurodeles waltl TaxID=8319 RepID=A0AAV7NIE0_PLEWA|nr:hypothetical protein NDU88_003968 [Pleurodeles waltl]
MLGFTPSRGGPHQLRAPTSLPGSRASSSPALAAKWRPRHSGAIHLPASPPRGRPTITEPALGRERPTGQVPPQEVRERRPRSAPQVLLGRTQEERRFKRLSRLPLPKSSSGKRLHERRPESSTLQAQRNAALRFPTSPSPARRRARGSVR